jgi:uncharacterized protein
MNKTKGLPSGLSKAQVTSIQGVFRSYPHIERATLYGSRAKGNYRPESDIDLSLHGSKLSYEELASIESDLDDLLLPHTIDLSLIQHIDNEQLLQHIDRVGRSFYIKP